MPAPKVLLYIPLAPKTPKIYARTLTSVLRMEWTAPLDYVLGRNDSPTGHKYLDLTAKFNQARRLTLEGGYDALMTIEADVIVPADALTRLAAVDADVSYGLYSNRHGWHKWLAYDHVHDSYTGASLSDVPELARKAWGQVWVTKGVGMGCTFIHRHVLEAIKFRCPDTAVANDWFFALDLQAGGYIQKHDLGCVCGHIQGAPDPKIYWPEPDGGYSVEFFDEAMPDPVQVKDGYQIHINKLGTTKEIFPAEAQQ